MKTSFLKFVSVFSIAFLLYACSTVPIIGRKQLALVDDNEIQAQAAVAYNNFLGAAETKVITGTNDATMVKNVGHKIASAVNTFLRENNVADQYDFNWEFNLIQSDEVNAWCMPGGKVAVYTGILPLTYNESGLATVMGHEIAHAIARHSMEQMSNQYAAQALGAAIGASTSKSKWGGLINSAYGLGGQVALLSYSRKNESEADRLGLIFMAMAGYEPSEAVTFWQRMASAKSSANNPPEFLSSHPSDQKRVNDLKKLLPEAQKYYRK